VEKALRRQSEVLATLRDWGMRVCSDIESVKDVKGCFDYYRRIGSKCAKPSYDIYGIVNKVDRLDYGESLGSKRERARGLGIDVLSESKFLHVIRTVG